MKWVLHYRCPNTGEVIRGFKGDKEVRCNCGRSNPAASNDRTHGSRVARFFSSFRSSERTEETGMHLVRFLERASRSEMLESMDPSIRPIIAELFKEKPNRNR
jgi:hypothetical protein